METYSFLRELADSWVLLVMFTFFVGTAIWAFWPGLAQAREDASLIPFRAQADRPPGAETQDCDASKGKTDV